jgi:hypothetical protein
MTKTVLSILRQAAEPMTSRDIAPEMLVTRALDKDDQKLLALMTKRVAPTAWSSTMAMSASYSSRPTMTTAACFTPPSWGRRRPTFRNFWPRSESFRRARKPASFSLGHYFAEATPFQVAREWERAAGTHNKYPLVM